jgi:hypothetical protein
MLIQQERGLGHQQISKDFKGLKVLQVQFKVLREDKGHKELKVIKGIIVLLLDRQVLKGLREVLKGLREDKGLKGFKELKEQ